MYKIHFYIIKNKGTWFIHLFIKTNKFKKIIKQTEITFL